MPELILSLAICAVILGDIINSGRNSNSCCACLALAGVILALASLLVGSDFGRSVFSFDRTLVHDGLSDVFKLIILIGTGLVVAFSFRSREIQPYRLGEYFSLVLGAALGACLLASSNNFVMFILAFETLSLCSYILASFIKHQRPSAEAGLKYMIYGAVTSGVMLFGISYFYGMTGTLDIARSMSLLTEQWASGENQLVILLSFGLVLAGLGFKMAMVPFHFWCPDVYQGSPTTVTAFLSVVSKSAGFAALLRVIQPVLQESGVFPVEGGLGVVHVFFGVLAAVTMTFGNLVAIRQTDVRRLLAYSSIAHAGYLLLGMAVFTPEAVKIMLVYLTVYLFMNLGAFWVVVLMVNKRGSSRLSEFRGAAYCSPILCIVMFIFLISLTGLPPTAGFAAKFLLFELVVGAGVDSMASGIITGPAAFYFTLAVIGMLNSVVSLFYYMKIIAVMVFEKAEPGTEFVVGWWDKAYGLALAVPVLALLNFGPLLDLVKGVVEPAAPILLSGVGQ